MDEKIIFMGSPDFAVPSLKKLASKYNIVGVVTQPDRPAGRGRIMTPPPVKVTALSLGIEIYQPNRLKEADEILPLLNWNPDLIVVVAFGQILRNSVLNLPRLGCINVHASLLPRWRGASPIQSAIFAGDQKTGVSIMKLDRGIDTGPILAQREVEIGPSDTALSLSERLANDGADLLVNILPDYIAGKILPQAQDEAGSTYAKMISKDQGLLEPSRTAEELSLQIRAFNPWPGTFLLYKNGKLKVHQAHVVPDKNSVPGKHKIIHGLPSIGTASGYLVIDQIQPAGKKAMSGDEFLRGTRDWELESDSL